MMSQWCLRVSAYAPRLLRDLDTIEWTDSIKETQRNWIGYSEGAEMNFEVAGTGKSLLIFTTRADTIFGVTFMVLAPESVYVDEVVTPEQRQAVDDYLDEVKHKTERERMIEKKVSGVFTGSYAINPVTGKEIPIEMREGAEISSMWYTEPMVCDGVELFNPAFDVTDHELLTGIITEKGLCQAPYEDAFHALGI